MKLLPRSLFIGVTIVSAMALSVCLTTPSLVAGGAKPTHKLEGGALKFEFDYSEAGDVFNDEVKKQIEDAGKFLASYIGNDITVKVKVVSDATISALALGAPSTSSEDTEERWITATGGVRFKESSVAQAGEGKTSVFALTVHELMHVLGFTDSVKAFSSKVKDGKFTGANTVKMNAGQDVPIDGGHFQRGFKDSQGMSPRVSDGGGDKLSILDLAVLADIGYSIPIIEGKDAPPVLNFVVHDSDFIALDFGGGRLVRMLQGYAGNDTLVAGDRDAALQGQGGADTLFSGKGNDMLRPDPIGVEGEPNADTIVIPAEPGNDVIEAFDEKDTIVLSPKLLGEETDIEKILADKEKFGPNGNFVGQWKLTLGEATIIIKHRDVQNGGSAPTKDNFKIEDREPPK